MYNVCVELPMVPWSSVHGARSRGYTMKDEETALKFQASLSRQLEDFKLFDYFVIIFDSGSEYIRHKVTKKEAE